MPQDIDETRITGRLPQLDIDIVHRRTDDAETVSVTLTALPSFRAVEQMLDAANPLQFWARCMALAWQPWLSALGQVTDATPQSGPQRKLPRR